ncbi:MAG TPA: DUF4349 domain-containing protein [Actinomycetota bacterium]|jgi:hypothetical protein
MRRVALVLIGFLALAGLVGYIATGGLSTSGDDAAVRGLGGGDAAFGATGATGGSSEEAADPAPEGDRGTDGTVQALPNLPEIGPAVIRTGQIAIEVDEGGFAAAFDTASLVAGKYGGYVQSSSMSGTDVRSGDLLLRVPADRFDEAMSDLRELGEVERQAVSGQDVSAEFVDLEARLQTWEAQELVLLDLMAQATTIEETIRVQGELQDVRFRIEQIEGQLRVLRDQTAYSTIQLSLRETGAPAATAGSGTRPSLAEAWERAVDGFLGVWFAVVVGLGYLIPLAAIGAIAWLGYRRLSAPRPAAP